MSSKDFLAGLKDAAKQLNVINASIQKSVSTAQLKIHDSEDCVAKRYAPLVRQFQG